VPFVSPLTRFAATAASTAAIPELVHDALSAAVSPRSGPAFVDFPLDIVFSPAADDGAGARPLPAPWQGPGADAAAVRRVAALLARALRVPVFLNRLARGCLPADDPLAFARTRGQALGECDLALVIGVPMDFRLGFGDAIAADASVVAIDIAPPPRPHPPPVAAELYGALPATLSGLLSGCGSGLAADAGLAGLAGLAGRRAAWVAALRDAERERRAAEAAELADPRAPLHPMRIYGELAQLLDRDAIVIGDGAFGFAGMELDTLARHGVAVVMVIANNGIWALEKHPMEMLYGYSVVADLRPQTRYDLVASALGCHAELVSEPSELRPALERAFGCGGPAVVNVLTDPAVAYPRRSNLA
jgi:acetolactate synthase-1/2/3 large subunit